MLLGPLAVFGWEDCRDAHERCWLHQGNRSLPLRHVPRGRGNLRYFSRASATLAVSSPSQHLSPVDEMVGAYQSIFAPSGNRNAASHLWAEYVFSRSGELTHEEMKDMFAHFCPVSGSPLPDDALTFKANLRMVGGGQDEVLIHHCCWPCICDAMDWIHLDTKSVTDKTGKKESYTVAVIGDPCIITDTRCSVEKEEGCLPLEAPAVVCEDGKLQNAVTSEHGHPIIGMVFAKDSIPGAIDFDTAEDDDGNSVKGACAARKEHGFDSGMGAIFQQVAMLNGIK